MALVHRPFPLAVAATLAAACTTAPAPNTQDAVTTVVVPTAGTAPETDPPPAEGPPAQKAGPRIRFQVPSIDGTATVSVEPGKVHVIHVWATFCAPCKMSLPALQKLGGQYGAAGLRVLAIAEDDADSSDSVLTFTKELGLTIPVAMDRESVVAKQLQVGMMPSTFILDRTGAVRFRHAGYRQEDIATLEEEVKGLL